jgi:heme-degrading monooxygenase HmoA
MSKEKHLEISSSGGKRAHELGKAHVWTSEEAVQAGTKSQEEKPRRARKLTRRARKSKKRTAKQEPQSQREREREAGDQS